VPAFAGAFSPTRDRETHLLSRSIHGGFPNGPSRNGAFSQDNQAASLAAFESDASDIVRGDTNGLTDVFVVHRGGRFSGSGGEPWEPASTQLASRGLGGAPANGRSWLPDLDGDAVHGHPHCVAFVSDASNLVPGDANGKPDAFVYDLRTGRTTLVSVDSHGAQSDGATYDVKIDGGCTRVAFTSDADNLALTSTKSARARPLVTKAPPPGTKQVYVHALNGGGDNFGLGKVTFLASASDHGVPGNGDSHDVSLGKIGDACPPSRCHASSGDSVSFTSDANNLTGGDGNGQPDVYQRTFRLSRDPTARHGGGTLRLLVHTRLVSATSSGAAGNGASTHPAQNDDGQYVAFETAASNLLPGDGNHVSDVALRGMWGQAQRMQFVSRGRETGPGNRGSFRPTITRPASIVFYESDASNLQPRPARHGHYADRNCMRDIFFWNTTSHTASLQSRDSDQSILNLPEASGAGGDCPPVIAGGSSHAAASYYGNYFLFESSYPLIDLPLAHTGLPSVPVIGRLVTPVLAATRSNDDPSLHQVYLRYNGPRSDSSHYPRSRWPLP